MKKIILGIGNTLNHDEGLGVHAVELLMKMPSIVSRDDIELYDGGTLGLNLLQLVESCSHLLILDTIDANKTPGSLIELKKEQIPLFKEIKMSEHQITFQEVLGLAKLRGKLPDNLYLLGMQPSELQLGVGLSEKVSSNISLLISRVTEIIQSW